MDISDVYYSDSSQLMQVETSNSSWCEQHTVLVGTENISWQEDGPEITVNYTETTAEQTPTENDGYLSADAGDSDEEQPSQYFSILESNNTHSSNTDENDDLVYANHDIENKEVMLPDANSDKSDAGVVLYRMEGSDELFAVQVADDGDGNLHKYQYKVRQTADGFEAIPGTIEMQDDNDEFITTEEPKKIINPKPTEHTIKSDPNIVSPRFLEDEPEELDNNFYMNNTEELNTEYLMENTYEQTEEYGAVTSGSDSEESDSMLQTTQVQPVKETAKTNIYPDSESEYEIEELEEAFQDDSFEEEPIINDDTPQILQHKSNLVNITTRPDKQLTQTLDSRNVTVYQDDNHLSYLVVKTKEKENVSLESASTFKNNNLRSILKCNNKTILLQKPEKTLTLPTIIANKDTSTKIKEPKPPVVIAIKSARQPRKQTIRPVERADSEITVQPLVYSLSEPEEADPTPKPLVSSKRKLITSEVYQVSDDSDPEFTLKPKKKKRKTNKRGRQKKTIEITILDSDDEDDSENYSDSSVIELSDEESSNEEQIPEETDDEVSEKCDEAVNNNGENDVESNKDDETEVESDNESKSEVESDDESKSEEDKPLAEIAKEAKSPKKLVGILKKHKCPICPKTFPRQITLKKHMAIHNNRRTLRSSINKTNQKSPRKTEPVKEIVQVQVKKQSFDCLKCKIKFLSESQYKRHQTVHNPKVLNGDARKSHQLISPKRNTIFANRLRASTRQSVVAKPQLRNKNECNKCEYCGQVFLLRTMLAAHRNTHKTFQCSKCKTTFTAKLLLDEHLKQHCGKPVLQRKKSLRASPERRQFKCGECPQKFISPRGLHIHLKIIHQTKPSAAKTNTTNTRLIARKRLAHGGVPVSLKMQKAFDKMKLKT